MPWQRCSQKALCHFTNSRWRRVAGDMPACSQRYFSLAEKRHDLKDIAENH
jgi:hypothetical protein